MSRSHSFLHDPVITYRREWYFTTAIRSPPEILANNSVCCNSVLVASLVAQTCTYKIFGMTIDVSIILLLASAGTTDPYSPSPTITQTSQSITSSIKKPLGIFSGVFSQYKVNGSQFFFTDTEAYLLLTHSFTPLLFKVLANSTP